MKESVYNILSKTGDFSLIEPEYKFKGKTDNIRTLNLLRDKQIYCELDPRINPNNKILIQLHTNTMNGALFVDKLIAATKENIYTGNLLYKYINSSNPATQGPLFRRFILDSEKNPKSRYPERPVYKQKSILNSYPEDQQKVNSFRKLRDIEKDWVYQLSFMNMPLYFQPKSERLDQMIKRYTLANVKRTNTYLFSESDAAFVFEPIPRESFETFTLNPYKKTRNNIINLCSSVELNGHNYPLSSIPENVLLVDFIGIPDIEVNNDDRIIRHNLGLLTRALNLGLEHENLEERVCIQLDNTNSEDLKKIYDLLKEKPVKGEVIVSSSSRTGLMHKVTRIRNNGEIEYSCTCEDYQFRVKPGKVERRTCKHIDAISE
ncbi:MAG: hypothetical protein PHF86_10495 [Candidatus Nanoarchaeia archaeon]|nr:hypothetical protein [Candidatus Nanoarchaeia archaeon]